MLKHWVERKVGKYKGKYIIAPSLEEILQDDFDYEKFVEEFFKRDYSDDSYSELLEAQEQKQPLKPEELPVIEILNQFEDEISDLQEQYENDLVNGTITKDYNVAMKQVAEKYNILLLEQIHFKLQKEKKQKTLIAKQTELISALKQVAEVKKNIEEGSNDRLESLVNHEIPLGKLYAYDLTKLYNRDVYHRHRQLIDKYQRLVFGNLADQEGIYYKPIEELHFKGNKK